ncbi:MAG: hypothetical protein DRP13_00825 [Candidatus Aenigmatarchaeota archaeon]|nr:MAG: hypothetical protein DRP13_00825 [Candidatus Aenigmarchaeota archaeon]
MIKMKKIIYPLLVFLFFAVPVNGFFISVQVAGTIKGSLDYINLTPVIYEGMPQEFLLNWENIGSVGCALRVRVDIYNNETGEFVYTAWSKKIPLEPGAYNLFKAYWYPDVYGNFTAKYSVLLCNDIYRGPELSFTVLPKNITQEKNNIITLKKIENTKNNIKLEITANEDINNLFLIPENPPLGWAVEYGEINKIKKGETKILTINYEPGIWKETNLSFNAVTKNGKYFGKINFFIEEKKGLNFEQILILILLIFLIISIFFNFYFFRKIKK